MDNNETKARNLERLVCAFDTYGGCMTKWPDDLQALYERYAQDPAIVAMKHEIDRLDALLRMAPAPPPIPKLDASIGRDIAGPRARISVVDYLQKFARPALAGLALMISSVAGAALAHATSDELRPELEFALLSNILDQARREAAL